VRAAQKSEKFKRFKRINRAVLAARRRIPERQNASVDAKLLCPSIDTALIEKMSIAGRMLETRAAAYSPHSDVNLWKTRATHERGVVK
jgi:hypothetical protein